MALALFLRSHYVADMADKTALPNDLAACHAMLSEHARVIAGKDRELAGKDSLIEQQAQRLEEQKAEISKLQAERDAALQLAFRKKIERYLPDSKQVSAHHNHP